MPEMYFFCQYYQVSSYKFARTVLAANICCQATQNVAGECCARFANLLAQCCRRANEVIIEIITFKWQKLQAPLVHL